jgi:hypothetical protein
MLNIRRTITKTIGLMLLFSLAPAQADLLDKIKTDGVLLEGVTILGLTGSFFD